jgi:predicted peroxiredoxin
MTNVDCVRPSTVLLVETHSPSDSLDSGDFLGFADSLLRQGSAVHLHLMQNGVLWVQRRSTSLTHIKQAFGEQVTLTCDDLSLDLRGIPHNEAALHAEAIGVDRLVELMVDPSIKTIWHS